MVIADLDILKQVTVKEFNSFVDREVSKSLHCRRSGNFHIKYSSCKIFLGVKFLFLLVEKSILCLYIDMVLELTRKNRTS